LADLPRSGPPKSSQRKNGPPPSKPKKGPPPAKAKPPNVDVNEPTKDISDAMAKLSLDSLPGNNTQVESVASYESLPGGGDYEYIAEGTFYSGEDIGRWKLEEDGSFTKME